jgi:hypothetical protein
VPAFKGHSDADISGAARNAVARDAVKADKREQVERALKKVDPLQFFRGHGYTGDSIGYQVK